MKALAHALEGFTLMMLGIMLAAGLQLAVFRLAALIAPPEPEEHLDAGR